MTARYVVTAACVQPLMGDGSGRFFPHVYQNGVLPEGVDKAQLKQLVETKMVERRDVADASPAEDGEWPGPDNATVDQVLEYVGDDADRAAEVLEQEQAGKNRSTLVERLQRIADPAAD